MRLRAYQQTMRKTFVSLLSSLLFAAACRRSGKLNRDQKEYEVVQEGSGGAVSSTISAPGEVAAPLMPTLTGTNADTTSAFNLPNAMTDTSTSAPPGTIAGTLPQDVYYPRQSRVPRTPPSER